MPQKSEERLNELFEKIEVALGPSFHRLDQDEVEGIRAILGFKDTLLRIARYEEAQTLVWSKNKSALITVATILAAILGIWANSEKLAAKIAQAVGWALR